jgi:hypothetical protein
MSTTNGMNLVLHFFLWILTRRQSDYNFIRNDDKCDLVGAKPIPAGVCADPEQSTWVPLDGGKFWETAVGAV